MSAQQTRDPEEALASNFAADKSGGRLEVWGIFAHGVLVAFLAGLLYLGVKPGGPGPVFVYLEGRLALGLLALFVIAAGLITSLLRRPFLQRGRLRSFLFVVVVFGLVNMQFPYPTPHAGHPSSTRFRLPVSEEWTVFWGGEDSDANRLASFLPDRRYGLDLVLLEDGKLFRGDGGQPSDWFSFGKEVLAPADGVVARVHTGEPDQTPRQADRSRSPEGNFIVLKTAENEYCFLMHLQADSIRVQVGDDVLAGQSLARVGSSGFSALTPMPHLAVHLQDTAEPRGEAIPWRFSDYLADGQLVERGLPTGGLARDGRPIGTRVRSK